MPSVFDFTVIIPYFQREPGVLNRCLLAVLAQTVVARQLPIQLIVVDDNSPHPAAVALEAFTFPSHVHLRIVQQGNVGPGGARNRGLDEAGPGCGYIAFLDSDDEWEPDHLERAQLALKAGASAYFADHYQLGQAVSAFARSNRLKLHQHGALDAANELHWFDADMPLQVMTGNLIGTSTVCFDPAALVVPRFRTDLRRAGEDYLFWIELSRAGARWAFSSRVAARYGRGVNVYSSVSWASPEFIERSRHEVRWRKTSLGLTASAPVRVELHGKIDRLREGIWLSFFSGMLAQLEQFGRSVRDDPTLLIALPSALFRRRR